jgi:hypothetical protein
MLRLVQACRYVLLVPSGAKACGAGGGAFRPEWREGPVERLGRRLDLRGRESEAQPVS